MNYIELTNKKKQLEALRPLPVELVKNLDDWFRVEITYTSNAIEGNTLTRKETALVVEKGITVGGKSLVEHLEATNHAAALDWVKKKISSESQQLTENDILIIHGIILKGIDDHNAGHYRSVPVRISGSAVVMPNPRKVPELMADFMLWLSQNKDIHPVELAADAHYRLVTIHPFVDGNGRTARLLMNMILMMRGYPPAIIDNKKRLDYISSLEKAQLGGTKDDYFKIVKKAVDKSLNIYLKAVNGEMAPLDEETSALIKIGELAKLAQESNSTIRHWTKIGLLEVAEITESGYQLYSKNTIAKINRIHELKKQRYTLDEIKTELEKSLKLHNIETDL